MLKLNHKKLEVWKASIELVTDIYRITNSFPISELYGLVNQVRRAAISVPSNISEGAARKSANERKRFYEISRSSLSEVDTQLEIAFNLGFIEKDDLLSERMNYLFALLSNLILKTV